MKRLYGNIRGVLALLLAMFLLLAGYFTYSVYAYGSRWFNSAYNPRIHQAKREISAGDLLDRNGVTLATTNAAGDRVYQSDASLRKAVAHVVGDDTGMLESGAETFHAGELLGFQQGLLQRIQQTFGEGARRGSDVTLTIDASLQAYIHSIFPSGKDGAVALINYKTGEIYALYSTPVFDVNRIGEVTTGSALVNRATQGQYAPGSIFKIITLTAALRGLSGAEERTFSCEGTQVMGEFTMTDTGGEGHGALDLHGAFNQSCNLAFGELGVDVGASALRRAAEGFGFNDNFLFKDLMLYGSRFPTEAMTTGKLSWTAVGQGDLTVSPLHMAMIAGAIGNGGVMMEPKLVQSSEGGRTLSPTIYRQCVPVETASKLRGYMRDCVTDGTAYRGAFTGGTVCGKTGTAQVASSGQGVEPHSWFIGFNDDPAKPLAIAVVIEKGGSGSQHAAPLAGNVMGRASRTVFEN